MKLTTSIAIVSFCLAGTACSENSSSEDAAVVATETAQVEDEYTGSLNLNLPSSSAAQDTGSGTLNLRIGQSDEDDGLLIGSGGFWRRPVRGCSFAWPIPSRRYCRAGIVRRRRHSA